MKESKKKTKPKKQSPIAHETGERGWGYYISIIIAVILFITLVGWVLSPLLW